MNCKLTPEQEKGTRFEIWLDELLYDFGYRPRRDVEFYKRKQGHRQVDIIYKISKNNRIYTAMIEALLTATENIGSSIEYVERFNKIKNNVIIYHEDNTKRDLKCLVYDIEHSNLKNKYQLLNQMKDFRYYKFEKIEEKSFLERNNSELLMGGAAVAGLVIADQDTKDDGEGSGVGILAMFVYTGLVLILEKMEKGKSKTYHQRVLVRPYYDN